MMKNRMNDMYVLRTDPVMSALCTYTVTEDKSAYTGGGMLLYMINRQRGGDSMV